MQSQLVQAILTFITTNIVKHEEVKDLEHVFRRLDTNQDGKLSKLELSEGFKIAYPHYDTPMINEIVDNIFNKADTNKSGQIDYTEYLTSALGKEALTTRDKLQKAFNSFDLVVAV